eukprot:6497601-Pyramimonas_sp.AAC.1
MRAYQNTSVLNPRLANCGARGEKGMMPSSAWLDRRMRQPPAKVERWRSGPPDCLFDGVCTTRRGACVDGR